MALRIAAQYRQFLSSARHPALTVLVNIQTSMTGFLSRCFRDPILLVPRIENRVPRIR